MRFSAILSLSLGILIMSCDQQNAPTPEDHLHEDEFCETCGDIQSSAHDKIYERGGSFFLWAGEEQSTHFDITGWALSPDGLTDWGNTRESFPALIAPPYESIDESGTKYADTEKVIFVKGSSGLKVYPYVLMKYHEVINEMNDGEPIMIGYCHLANLAAVYTRNYCGQEFTFAVSGYTYGEEYTWEGRDGFVLWDRDTESLWWPLIDRAVSGIMKDTQLKKHTQANWGLSTWGEITALYPSAMVLTSDQNWAAPTQWPAYEVADLSCAD